MNSINAPVLRSRLLEVVELQTSGRAQAALDAVRKLIGELDRSALLAARNCPKS